ncbi:MAG: GIY-YIG nuclease family protein [Patescibacteria group bacterium]
MWHIYILQCKDKTFYTGITTDLKRRVKEHNTSTLGAKYTRGRRPVKLVYTKTLKNKSAALKEELRIKQLTRAEKLQFLSFNKIKIRL